MREDILQKAKEWTKEPFDPDTRKEILELIEKNQEKELIDRFYQRIEFGTGGMRGVMEAGLNRMNLYTVAMATQGLALYLKEIGIEQKGVVITYDTRRNSYEFARTAALVLVGNQIPVYLTDKPMPTPFLSFAIRYLQAAAGIVVTASHNPPEYNGYKVFFSDGGQVLPPHDKAIIQKVEAVSSFTEVCFGKEEKIQRLSPEVEEKYLDSILPFLNTSFIQKNAKSLKVVYTPLHGTGRDLTLQLLSQRLGIPVFLVEEQASFDGNFPTVKSPNPEEREALSLAIEKAKALNADIVLGTDPDADRLGVVVRHQGEYIALNGNQVGSILLCYLLENRKIDASYYAVSTIVSSDIIYPITQKYGIEAKITLTGFKYIGEVINHLEKEKKFLFGYEESFGFLIGDNIRDKDGISASSLLCEVSIALKNQGKTLWDYLMEIYEQYGFYYENLASFTLKGIEGLEQIKSIMEFLRKNAKEKLFDYPVQKRLDLKEQKIWEKQSEKPYTLFPKSDVLVYYVEPYFKIAVRPSGTEPKIKFYTAINGKKTSRQDYFLLKNELVEFENKILKEIEKIK